jgi:uncharacterized protein YuzE
MVAMRVEYFPETDSPYIDHASQHLDVGTLDLRRG